LHSLRCRQREEKAGPERDGKKKKKITVNTAGRVRIVFGENRGTKKKREDRHEKEALTSVIVRVSHAQPLREILAAKVSWGEAKKGERENLGGKGW